MIDKRNLGAGQASVVPSSIRILMPNGHVTEMKLETYLAGVVAMEIGSNAPLEALKAQAVASRTYAAAAPRHVEKNADVCTTTHCQKWKRVDPIVAPEVFRAVSETWGVVALHEGKLIEAFFFEHCSGQTRNSEDMAMAELAYLRSVNCPCGFSDMRGHGVGLCQRGAIVLARNGASFEQILRHYYRGIAIVRTQREEQPRREQPVVKKGKEPRTKTSAPLGKPSQSKPAPVPNSSPRPAPVPGPSSQPAPVPGPSSQPAPVPSPSSQPTPVPSPSPQPAPESHEITTLIKMLRQTQATKQGAAPEKPAPPLGTSESAEKASADASAIELEPKGFRADAPSMAPARPDGVRQEMPMAPSVPDGVGQETPMAPSVPDGVRQEMLAQPSVPAPEALRTSTRIHVDNLPGPRMIAGCLPCAGISVNIEDMHGNKTMLFGGSAPHYGEGGFEMLVDEDGYYAVSIEEQVVEVNVRGDTAFIRADSVDKEFRK